MKNLIIIIFLSFLTACGPRTNVTKSWSSTDAPGKPLNKVMIVAIMPEKDRILREQMEQKLAENFAAEGYTTTSAYAEYGPKALQGLNEAQALKKIKSSNIDGVITISLLDREKEESYAPGKVTYFPFANRYNRFWSYYTTYFKRVYSPTYYTTGTNYFIETNLYDVVFNKLLYAAQSETFDLAKAQNLAATYSIAIVKNMKEKKLLNKNSTKP